MRDVFEFGFKLLRHDGRLEAQSLSSIAEEGEKNLVTDWSSLTTAEADSGRSRILISP